MNILPAARSLVRNPSYVRSLSKQLSPVPTTIAFRRLKSTKPTPTPPVRAPQPVYREPPETLDDADPRGNPRPVKLIRPLGMQFPPRKGQNSGVDPRTLQQKRDDFVNWDKHLEKRKRLTSQFGTSYFQDFNTIDSQYKGKSWIAPDLIFKEERSLYFPNFQGRTLVPPRRAVRDTTDVIVTPSPGVISVVAVFSSMWAQNQVKSFMDHPDVAEVLEGSKGIIQRVDINIEQNKLKAMLITFFVPSLRKTIPEDRHDKYFIVKQGVTDEIRSQVGLVNGKVGYVYLVDGQGKIRWAASGVATDDEIEALVKGMERLINGQSTLLEQSAARTTKEDK